MLGRAEPPVHAVEAAFRAESLHWADAMAARRDRAELDPHFVEVHPSQVRPPLAEAASGSSAGGAGTQGGDSDDSPSLCVPLPAVDGMCHAGAALPLRPLHHSPAPSDGTGPEKGGSASSTTPSGSAGDALLAPELPPILVVDASLLDQVSASASGLLVLAAVPMHCTQTVSSH